MALIIHPAARDKAFAALFELAGAKPPAGFTGQLPIDRVVIFPDGRAVIELWANGNHLLTLDARRANSMIIDSMPLSIPVSFEE
jgi:hypothetical protein